MSNNNKRGRRYTKNFKDSILKRLHQPSNETVASISDETDIPKVLSTSGSDIIIKVKKVIL